MRFGYHAFTISMRNYGNATKTHMPRSSKYYRIRIPCPGAGFKHKFKERELNSHQTMKYWCYAFHNDAEHAQMYAFRRCKRPALLFACFRDSVTTLEYTTFIMVWAPSKIWQHYVLRKYYGFIERLLQNRLAARCFDGDYLRTPSKNANRARQNT